MNDQRIMNMQLSEDLDTCEQDGHRLQMSMAAIGMATIFASALEASFVYPPPETDVFAIRDDLETF